MLTILDQLVHWWGDFQRSPRRLSPCSWEFVKKLRRAEEVESWQDERRRVRVYGSLWAAAMVLQSETWTLLGFTCWNLLEISGNGSRGLLVTPLCISDTFDHVSSCIIEDDITPLLTQVDGGFGSCSHHSDCSGFGLARHLVGYQYLECPRVCKHDISVLSSWMKRTFVPWS